MGQGEGLRDVTDEIEAAGRPKHARARAHARMWQACAKGSRGTSGAV